MSPGAAARYDGHAKWYDESFANLASPAWADLVSRLLGGTSDTGGLCLDIGCGTGLHFAAIQAAGYLPLGIDISRDQITRAKERRSTVAQADAARLPIATSSVACVFSAFTHTDVDDFPAALTEVARVLRPGGRFVYLGLHPCFVGTFVNRRGEFPSQALTFQAGYGNEQLDHHGIDDQSLTTRVGRLSLTLSSLLTAFIAIDHLKLVSLQEFDTEARTWRAEAGDGRIVPWNVAIITEKQ